MRNNSLTRIVPEGVAPSGESAMKDERLSILYGASNRMQVIYHDQQPELHAFPPFSSFQTQFKIDLGAKIEEGKRFRIPLRTLGSPEQGGSLPSSPPNHQWYYNLHSLHHPTTTTATSTSTSTTSSPITSPIAYQPPPNPNLPSVDIDTPYERAMIVVTSNKDRLNRTDGEDIDKIPRVLAICFYAILGCMLLWGLYTVAPAVWRRIRSCHDRDQQQEEEQEQKPDDQPVWKPDPAYIV